MTSIVGSKRKPVTQPLAPRECEPDAHDFFQLNWMGQMGQLGSLGASLQVTAKLVCRKCGKVITV